MVVLSLLSLVLAVSLYRRISGPFVLHCAPSALFSVHLLHARFLSTYFSPSSTPRLRSIPISIDIRIVVASHPGRPCQVLITVSLAVRYTHQSSHRRRNSHPCIACAMKYVLLERRPP